MTRVEDQLEITSRLTHVPLEYRRLGGPLLLLSDVMTKVIGGVLSGFSALPNPMLERFDERYGEFCGIGGITNRGEPDQLLASEWALQSLYAEEFVRRFAEGEALYVKKDYKQEGLNTIYMAMVSSGPQSLGYGRFVSIASLFHLAWLAQKQGAHLYWCGLIPGCEMEQIKWHEGISRASLRKLINAATTTEPDEADIETSLEAFKFAQSELLEDVDRLVHWVITPTLDLSGHRVPLLVAARIRVGLYARARE